MNSEVFEEVLRDMDAYFRILDKKILLLVDNAPSHFDPHYRPPEPEQNENNREESSSTTARGGNRTRTSRSARGILLKLNIFFICNYKLFR